MTDASWSQQTLTREPEFADYVELLKPRVMRLVVFTAIVGLVAAPVPMHPVIAVAAILCIAVGAGAVWVANSGDGSVSRIDPRSNAVTKAISVGDAPVAIATEADAVWVANSGDGTVSRIDPRANKVVSSIRVGHRPRGITVSEGAVWVTLEG